MTKRTEDKDRYLSKKKNWLKWPIWPEVFVDQNCYCQSCWHFLIWFCTLYTFTSKHITPTYNKSFKAVESFSQEKNLRASKLLSHKSFPFPSRKKEWVLIISYIQQHMSRFFYRWIVQNTRECNKDQFLSCTLALLWLLLTSASPLKLGHRKLKW